MADERESAAKSTRPTPPAADPQSPSNGISEGAEADSTDTRGSRAALMTALHVRRNLGRGLVVGVLIGVAALAVFVLSPPATERPPGLYPLLAFVLATTSGALVAAVLVAHRARSLSKSD